jgi:hypothetical protein
MYAYVVVCILIFIDLICCCGCDAGAQGTLAQQSGIILTRLLRDSGCICAFMTITQQGMAKALDIKEVVYLKQRA